MMMMMMMMMMMTMTMTMIYDDITMTMVMMTTRGTGMMWYDNVNDDRHVFTAKIMMILAEDFAVQVQVRILKMPS